MTLFAVLFATGILTILLPCILPLVPIVVGVSIGGQNRWRPLFTVLGMLISFVFFTFLLFVVLDQFVELADYIRISTYYILLLFGLGFITDNRYIQYIGTILGAAFFWNKGPIALAVAAAFGFILMGLGGRIASRIQQLGTNVQGKARSEFGESSPITAFFIGLTLGLVWVPCAGPALSFVFTLIRDEPGLQAFFLLLAYGLGTAIPLLAVGYGGQQAVYSARYLVRFTGYVKHAAGALLIFSAVALQYNWFLALDAWLVSNTRYGTVGTDLEERFFGDFFKRLLGDSQIPSDDDAERLPDLGSAPELTGLGTWHNSKPLTLQSLRGKVVLVDFWTYSCINCIRTLPYLKQYWEKYGIRNSDGTIDVAKSPFVLLGVHSPEFTFEKSDANVADAIRRYELTYPIVQDNEFATWRAFENHYWPAKYLIDAQGNIRYRHFGEGDYEETDKAIEALLKEAGVDLQRPQITEKEVSRDRQQTPETYIGQRSWSAFGNGPARPTDEAKTYLIPNDLTLHKYYLGGTWQLQNDERQTLLSNTGEIAIRFLGTEINLVMGLDDGSHEVVADVFVDDTKVKTITVNRNDLYQLFRGAYGEHVLRLKIKEKGVSAFAFTFGS